MTRKKRRKSLEGKGGRREKKQEEPFHAGHHVKRGGLRKTVFKLPTGKKTPRRNIIHERGLGRGGGSSAGVLDATSELLEGEKASEDCGKKGREKKSSNC